MIVVMAPGATEEQIQEVQARLADMGLDARRSPGRTGVVLGVQRAAAEGVHERLRALPGVREVVAGELPFPLASRACRAETTQVRVGRAVIGGSRVTLIAGPCAVESEAQTVAAAEAVAAAGATLLRGGAFKPRTSPYSFQGLGEDALRILRDAADRCKLAVVTEVMDRGQLELVARYADMLQVGSRNMHNYALLREVARAGKPVLLKRGMSATVEEWLLSAEHLLAQGNGQVALCERGVRTFEPYTRNTLDLSSVPLVQRLSHLPVIVDPSHATGRRELVASMARAAVAAGADGLMIEVHPLPETALSDGPQSLDPAAFAALAGECRAVARAVGRDL